MTGQRLTAIIPCNDIDASEAFWNRLGFFQDEASKNAHEGYRMLADGKGGEVHLNAVDPGWIVPERNAMGMYLYTLDVDAVAETMRDEIIEKEKRATHKSWGMYEFAMNSPDDTLVRVGWPSRLLS